MNKLRGSIEIRGLISDYGDKLTGDSFVAGYLSICKILQHDNMPMFLIGNDVLTLLSTWIRPLFREFRRLIPETTEKLSEVLYLATSHIFQVLNYAFQGFA